MRPARIAIVGAGYMAEEHIRAFTLNKNAEIVGITSRTMGRAKALAIRHQIAGVFHSVPELFEETRADAVVLAVNEISVQVVALEALQYPWLLLIEKPAGSTYDEAALIAMQGNERSFVALNRRYFESTRRLLGLLEEDDAPRFVVVDDQQDLEEAERAGRGRSVLDNWMYANSIHLIDLLRLFCRGTVETVDVHEPWRPEHPTIVAASVGFSSGDRGMYVARWNRPGPWSVSVSTDQNRWVMAPLESLSVQPRGERRLRAVRLKPSENLKPGLARLSQDVVRALEGRPHKLPTLGDSLESMDLVRQIYFPER